VVAYIRGIQKFSENCFLNVSESRKIASDPFIENNPPPFGRFFRKTRGVILKGGVIFRSLYCFFKGQKFFRRFAPKKKEVVILKGWLFSMKGSHFFGQKSLKIKVL
jgi:hypothetical protein